MDIQELIDITSKPENNPFAINDCNSNCASTFSLWSKVRILEVKNYKTEMDQKIFEIFLNCNGQSTEIHDIF